MSVESANRTGTYSSSSLAVAIVIGALGSLLGDLLSRLVLDAIGPTFGGLTTVALFIIGFVATTYYWTILGYGAFPAGSGERKRYDQLRVALLSGGRAGTAYHRILGLSLSVVDRFFGDRGQDQPRLRKVFGLEAAAPLWTAESFDRCLLIAVLYPLVIIILFWLITGAVGPMELALGLRPAVPAGARWLQLALLVAFLLILFRCPSYWPKGRLSAALAIAAAGAGILTIGGLGTLWLLVAFVSVTIPLLFAAVIAGLLAIRLNAETLAHRPKGNRLRADELIRQSDLEQITRLGSGIVALGLVFSISVAIGSSGWLSSVTVSLLILVMVLFFTIALPLARALLLFSLLTFVLINLAAALGTAKLNTPLLFLCLLPLVNAPFDWITLGLSRGLLRRGLELGGWWPVVLGAVDLVAALVTVAALSVALLWGVQLYGHFTVLGSSRGVLDFEGLLAGIGSPHLRGDAAYWGLYAMLLATLVPSILNIAVGAMSIIRGVPGLNGYLAARLPTDGGVIQSERMWMAPLLALQAVLSAAIAVAGMLGVLWVVVHWLLPLFGSSLSDILSGLAARDLPGRLLESLHIL